MSLQRAGRFLFALCFCRTYSRDRSRPVPTGHYGRNCTLARFLLLLIFIFNEVKRFLLIGCMLLIFMPGFSQTTTGKKNYFAVGLFTSAYSSMLTYAIVTFRNDVVVSAQIITEERFMYEAFGYYPSIANVNKENLFAKYGVDSCFMLSNDLNKIVGYYCKPFQDLWKLRFYEHPYNFDTPGWSQGQFKPSIYQMKILREEYGINNVLTDYFYGDSLFKLLRDVQRPSWIQSYKYAVKDTSATNTGQP